MRPGGSPAGTVEIPNEAATLILWLCSPDLSDVTGAHVVWNDPWVIRGLDLFLSRATALGRAL